MFTARGGSGTVFWVTLVLLLAVKAWNMLAVWYEQRLTSRGERASHIVLRLLLNTAVAYLLFDQAPYWLTLALLLLMALLYVFYFRMLKTKHVLKWDRLIEIESGMVLFFYRIANAFTDVPQLRKKYGQGPICNGQFLCLAATSVLFTSTYMPGRLFVPMIILERMSVYC